MWIAVASAVVFRGEAAPILFAVGGVGVAGFASIPMAIGAARTVRTRSAFRAAAMVLSLAVGAASVSVVLLPLMVIAAACFGIGAFEDKRTA
jgi:hypothetical protein